ncbi:MAG: aminopeptidase P N-terminal domain-containing protein, partial [Gammaproteobacteria bacterium]|nr:aminopeptidase P N-terminal domain-containing protein [Gammaproteobacteria bacterium]
MLTLANEYKTRRLKLADQLLENSIAIIPAAGELLRNGDAHYRFRQDSDFYYLTGFNEPDALLVITSGPNSQSILFNRVRNPAEEQWTGKRLGQEGAVNELGMNAAFGVSAIAEELPKLLSGTTAPSSSDEFFSEFTSSSSHFLLRLFMFEIKREISLFFNSCDKSK